MMETIHDLEHQLNVTVERLKRAIAALAPNHKRGEWEEYQAANQEVLLLERQLAAAKGEEYAEPFGFPVKWDTGAPLPHLMVNDNRVLLAFLLSEPNPDGTYVRVTSPSDEGAEPLALAEFDFCIAAKLGAPNDEVFKGHPLNGKGLEPYTAQRVVNSRWLKEIKEINSVHRLYRPESWREQTHFIFWFHDSTFECIAQSYKVETYWMGMTELLGLMVERLIP
jgi:hypothetical protein